MIEIYTDGACSSLDYTGGWAMIAVNCGNMEYFNTTQEHGVGLINQHGIKVGGAQNTTNNRMELSAIEAAMIFAANKTEEPVTIYTDSAYIANCFKDKWYIRWEQNGWRTAKKTPVEHQDLWQSILSAYRSAENRISVQHVKAHASNEYNNLADQCAVSARQAVREHLATQE